MQKAAIFDLDGTLLYTLEDLKNSVNFALEKYNFPARTLDEVRSFVGNGVGLLMERSIPDGLKNLKFKECLECFKKHYAENMYNNTKPFEGIVEMLEELNSRGYKIGVVSNKFDKAVKDLCVKFFGNRVEIAIGESRNVRKKPAPDSILCAIKILKCDKDYTYYVGDSEIDIQTAKNSGLRSISVTWGYKDKEFLKKHYPKIIVDKPCEIMDILK